VSVLHPIILKDQSKCENNDFDNLIIESRLYDKIGFLWLVREYGTTNQSAAKWNKTRRTVYVWIYTNAWELSVINSCDINVFKMGRKVLICLMVKSADPESEVCMLQTLGPLIDFRDNHWGSKGYLEYPWKLGAKSLKVTRELFKSEKLIY